MVKKGTVFEVGDHDLIKYSLIPFVALLVDLAHDVNGSWYDGQVHAVLNEHGFEPSSAVRYVTELSKTITSKYMYSPVPPMLYLYTDGGPDYNLMHVTVQLSLIALFLHLDLDYIYMCITYISLPFMAQSCGMGGVYFEPRSTVYRINA